MKLSARNQLKGKIVEVKKGATTTHVRIDIGGQILTASITNEQLCCWLSWIAAATQHYRGA
jgi:molybdopterin-binding protein